MENLKSKVIKALAMRLGEKYTIIPKDIRKNNGLILHGICIERENDSINPVIYMEDFIQDYDMEEMNPEEIADIMLKVYRQDKISQNVADHIKEFGIIKERVRIKLINHTANLKELENIPHRKFLDLAVTYYLDLKLAITGDNGSAVITNKMMEMWGITENNLYRLGMEKLLAEDECCIIDMLSILRQIMQEEQDKIAEYEKDKISSEMYVASNQKNIYGANCLMNVPILQELAEKIGCSLIIFPCSVHELVIIPQKNGTESYLSTEDIQTINITQVSRNEWLSNSIYRYDKEKREVFIYKEGAPL